MKRKCEALSCFMKYHRFAEKHTGSKISSVNVIYPSNFTEKVKALRTDNGGEYISTKFKAYLDVHGIEHQLTVAYTPQQMECRNE